MNIFAIFLFVIVVIIASVFIFYVLNIVAPALIPLISPTFRPTANTIGTSGTAYAATGILVMIVIMILVGSLADLFIASKYPNVVLGVANIFLFFLTIAIWLVANRFIFNAISIPLLTSNTSPLFTLFSSTWFITIMSLVLLVSASLHLGGKQKR